MKIYIASFVLLALMIGSASAYAEEDGSLILTELDFHKAVEEYKYVLVNFHALWCRYSKKLKPEWAKLVEKLKDEKPEVKLAKVEAYDEKKLAEEYDIDGYPTIKMFIDGKPHSYSGERLESHLLEFVNRKLKKPLRIVDSANWIKEMLKEYEWIGVYSGEDDSGPVKNVAFEMGDVLFVRGNFDEYKKFDFALVNNITGDFDGYKGDITTAALTEFIEKHKFPAVPRFSKGTAERIFLSEDPSMILIKKDDAAGKKAVKAFSDANDNLKDKIFMSVASYEEEIGKLLADNLGVKESDLPTVRIVRPDMEKIRKYVLVGDITADSVTSFYDNLKAKKAKRYYVSEPVPEENKDLVLKVVGDTFKQEVLNPDKDVLVLFWAPWCGHCRAMMPVYDNVARKTKPVDNFVVAKVDASVNELEGYGIDIVEYPTILLFTRKDKENPIEFKGERNEYAFNDFIRAHASVNLDRMKGPNPFDKNEL